MTAQSTQQTLKEKLGGRNIFLIGMMGSGKTQTGPYLARLINYAFVDTDDVIEKLQSKLLQRFLKKTEKQDLEILKNKF